jgi:hypothetical protein
MMPPPSTPTFLMSSNFIGPSREIVRDATRPTACRFASLVRESLAGLLTDCSPVKVRGRSSQENDVTIDLGEN